MQILGFTNYWNYKLGTDIDANVIKAMAYVETKIGYFQGSASANGSIDIMQVLDGRNPAIQRLAAEGNFDPNEGSMPKDGYIVFKRLFPNGKYDNSAANVEMSVAAGVRWFIHNSGSVERYNGGGDGAYAGKVTDALKLMN